jgi:small G protein signaling modulator 1
VNNFSPMFYKGSICYKFLWIRLALINKLLSKIIEHIVKNSNMYYNTNALIADPVNGLIFSSLLIGPCTIEYTRMKICDYLWADQNADEVLI